MNVVFIVPTGIGCEIGGHAGDATPAAKLIASVCDKLIVHPNVVNASDINEMTENMLYVEGSTLDGFLAGRYGLREVSMNRILLVVNAPILPETINAVNAARATIGADIKILQLPLPILMHGTIEEGIAKGRIENLDTAMQMIAEFDNDWDVMIVNTPIQTFHTQVMTYLHMEGGVNPWGKVEAMLSKKMSTAFDRQVIHAPIENSDAIKTFNKTVDPRKAAEMVSVCYIHSCFKGAHKAPMRSKNFATITYKDIDFLISPADLSGPAHKACRDNGIPIIAVRENQTQQAVRFVERGQIYVENYLEAAGVICAKKAGVSLASTRRPLLGVEI